MGVQSVWASVSLLVAAVWAWAVVLAKAAVVAAVGGGLIGGSPVERQPQRQLGTVPELVVGCC